MKNWWDGFTLGCLVSSLVLLAFSSMGLNVGPGAIAGVIAGSAIGAFITRNKP